jgi:hypothetical protein
LQHRHAAARALDEAWCDTKILSERGADWALLVRGDKDRRFAEEDITLNHYITSDEVTVPRAG